MTPLAKRLLNMAAILGAMGLCAHSVTVGPALADNAPTPPHPSAAQPAAPAVNNDDGDDETNAPTQAPLPPIPMPTAEQPSQPPPPPSPAPASAPASARIPPAAAAQAPSPTPTPAGPQASTRTIPTPAAPSVPPPAQAMPGATPAAPTKPTLEIIEFQNAPVFAVLDYYARLTNRSIISAPNLAGTINFRSQTNLTLDEAIQALDSVLAINGIGTVPMGEKFLKVVQIATAKQEGLPFGGQLPPADTLVTQVIPLKFADASETLSALQPYLHPYGQLLPLQKSNAILITDTGANINQMLEIIKYIDQPSALRMQTKIYVMKYAKAADVMQRLQSIIQETQQLGARAAAPQPGQPQPPRVQPRPGAPAAAASTAGGAAGEESVVEGKVILTADERTNKMFVLSRPSNFDFFDKIVAELDAKVEPDVITKVISLNFASAEDAAGLVNSLITGGSYTPSVRRTSTTGTGSTGGRAPSNIPPPPAATSGGGAGIEGTGFLQFAQGVRVFPDPRTNSILVMATKEDLARIEQLIRSIDTSVAQVQIEVVIAEVTLNNELDVGVNVFKRLFEKGQVTQTGGSSTDGNAPVQLPKASDMASVLASNLPTAAALASGPGGLTYFATFQNLKLDAVLHALATTSKAKVLSTPVIQTMDNQEANILVGSSVPVPVSTVSSLVSGTGTLATGQLNANIEYKDVAIELKVTPRVNPDGYVRMDIEQKVNDLGANVTISGTTVPEIVKREAKSSVAVQDGSTIVLGGLIKEDKNVTETKVPFLGDIPFLGHLFKNKTNNKKRDELIIFIRPTVMRTDAQAVAEAHRRARLLKAGEELELEKRFGSAVPGAPTSKLNEQPSNNIKPPATPAAKSGDTSSTEAERRDAKMKALQEQDEAASAAGNPQKAP